ncbi:MAG: endonuclease V [Candidatus Bathyarchaeia archaeon]
MSPSFSWERAAKIQESLATLISRANPQKLKPSTVGGADAAYKGERAAVAVAVCSYPGLELVEKRAAILARAVPYRPGFLGFSEGPLIIRAASLLSRRPDALLVDGHGQAHPRRFGLACHVGLALGMPTVGVAKRPLTGKVEGGSILDDEGRIIGQVIKRGVRTLYVSVGYKISLEDASAIVSGCLANGSPEPLRIAHQEAEKLKRSL